MTVGLNHTIVAARDNQASAEFLCELLGLPAATEMGHFMVVKVGDTSLDFVQTESEIHPQHYAFDVTEAEFDQIFGRIKSRQLDFWADPFRKKAQQINRWDGGRGVYWEDPDGHLLEIITRPYGSGGSTTDNPHPLVES